MAKLETGLDVLVADKFSSLVGKRVAILANQASVDKNLDHIVALAVRSGVNVIKLFAPEHGMASILQDMEHDVALSVHETLKIPVISLYGDHKESLKLKASHLSDVDVLLCDLQDIGSRYYTFHCTIAWALASACETNTQIVIIDRPNPINAHHIEGNLVKDDNFSFVGAYPLPNRHGFTMGELVHFVRDFYKLNLNLEVIWMMGYARSHYFDEFALPFVPPSPNMPTVNTAMVYPGMCLIEGTNLSEGRGTCTPFELVGAPYIKDPEEFKKKIDRHGFLGVTLRACQFQPKFQKHQNQTCGGVFVHVTNRSQFQPLRLALSVIASAMTYDGFDWRREPYEFETDRVAIDLLLGDGKIRKMLEDHVPLTKIFALFDDEETHFEKTRANYLHYP